MTSSITNDTKLKEKVIKLLQQNNHDIIMVVAHFGCSYDLPTLVGKYMLEGVSFGRRGIKEGQAWFIDFTTKTLQLISP